MQTVMHIFNNARPNSCRSFHCMKTRPKNKMVGYCVYGPCLGLLNPAGWFRSIILQENYIRDPATEFHSIILQEEVTRLNIVYFLQIWILSMILCHTPAIHSFSQSCRMLNSTSEYYVYCIHIRFTKPAGGIMQICLCYSMTLCRNLVYITEFRRSQFFSWTLIRILCLVLKMNLRLAWLDQLMPAYLEE